MLTSLLESDLGPIQQQAPPTADSEHEIPDVFTGLALAYNLQFPDIATNVTVSCLAGKAGAKVWTEKILLLLNREEDPTDILTRMNPDDGGASGSNKDFPITNSVHKVKMKICKIFRMTKRANVVISPHR